MAIRMPTALGTAILVKRTSRSCPLPGSAQRGLLERSWSVLLAIVREDILLRPASEVEESARREEVETGLRERRAIFAGEADVELLLELVEIAHVSRGIFALRIAQFVGSPV